LNFLDRDTISQKFKLTYQPISGKLALGSIWLLASEQYHLIVRGTLAILN
jgi:hypothetical protein